MSNRPKPRGVRPPGARDLPRRLFPMNSVEKERKQMLVQPIGSSSYGYSAARSSRRSSGLALPRDRFGPLAPIEEGDEERKEGPTLPTKMKPSRHLAENRLRWLRDRLLTRSGMLKILTDEHTLTHCLEAPSPSCICTASCTASCTGSCTASC